MENGLMTKARDALDVLWLKEFQLQGWCDGQPDNGNPFAGKNIVVADEYTVLCISESPNGKLAVRHFRRSGNGTFLGGRVIKAMSQAGLALDIAKYVMFIPAEKFEAFKASGRYECRLPHGWKLEIGDHVIWRVLPDLKGVAVVTACRSGEDEPIPGQGPIFTFQKVNQGAVVDDEQVA